MPSIKNRLKRPCPEVVFQEIQIPDDSNFGTGTFCFVADKGSLTPPRDPQPHFISVGIVNAPRFQINVTLNPGTGQIPVLLGRADGTPPFSNTVVSLPPKLDASASHEFIVTFRNWRVLGVEMDGKPLKSVM